MPVLKTVFTLRKSMFDIEDGKKIIRKSFKNENDLYILKRSINKAARNTWVHFILNYGNRVVRKKNK